MQYSWDLWGISGLQYWVKAVEIRRSKMSKYQKDDVSHGGEPVGDMSGKEARWCLLLPRLLTDG